jgi:hypothetical protein
MLTNSLLSLFTLISSSITLTACAVLHCYARVLKRLGEEEEMVNENVASVNESDGKKNAGTPTKPYFIDCFEVLLRAYQRCKDVEFSKWRFIYLFILFLFLFFFFFCFLNFSPVMIQSILRWCAIQLST